MSICEQTFALASEQLSALNYDDGPVGVAVDDTKPSPAWCLVRGSTKDSLLLIGAMDGPVQVSNPVQARELIDQCKVHPATKVSNISSLSS